jgi:hypothetical protein
MSSLEKSIKENIKIKKLLLKKKKIIYKIISQIYLTLKLFVTLFIDRKWSYKI